MLNNLPTAGPKKVDRIPPPAISPAVTPRSLQSAGEPTSFPLQRAACKAMEFLHEFACGRRRSVSKEHKFEAGRIVDDLQLTLASTGEVQRRLMEGEA